MEHQNQVARRLRSDPARLAGVLAGASREGVTSRGQIADRVCTDGLRRFPDGSTIRPRADRTGWIAEPRNEYVE